MKFCYTQLVQLCINLDQDLKTHILSTHLNVLVPTDDVKCFLFGAKAIEKIQYS